MMHQPKHHSTGPIRLEGAATQTAITLAANQALAEGDLEIDREAGVIRNVAIISRGPAHGHGFDIDETTVQQVVSAIQARGATGVKSRLTHPNQGIFGGGSDPAELMLGRVKNARVENGKARGDLHIAQYAAKSPSGDLRDFVLSVAEEDPSAMGLSIVFDPAPFEERQDESGRSMPPAARIQDVTHVDVVGDPGANPDGFLSSQESGHPPREQKEGAPMDKVLSVLATALGVSAAVEEVLTKLGEKKDSAIGQLLAGQSKEVSFDALSSAADASGAKLSELVAAVEQDGISLSQPRSEPAPQSKPSTETGGGQDGGEAERTRAREIRALAELAGLGSDWALARIEDGSTVEKAKQAALERRKAEQAGGGEELASGPAGGSVRVGEDRNLSTLGPAMTDALILRSEGQLLKKDTVGEAHQRAHEFRGLTMLQMFREHLATLGAEEARRMPDSQLIRLLNGREFSRRFPRAYQLAQSTSDFSNVLVDAINKSLRAAYMDAAPTWSIWARRSTAPDFKTINRVNISEAPDLQETDPDGEEITYVALSDQNETYSLKEYKGGLRLTRKAIINDDTDAFGRIPMLHAAAARRREDESAYNVLINNNNMRDGNALFDSSNHGNVVTSGGAPSVSELEKTEKLLLNAKGPKGDAFLELQGAFLLVPTALRAQALEVVNSTVNPAKSNRAINPFNGRFEVVPSARLNANSESQWYLLADHRTGRVDTVEVAFLEGEEEPVLEQESDFDTDDAKFKVRHNVAAKAIDWRGVARNDGS